MFLYSALCALSWGAIASAQQVGTLETENHPRITIQECRSGGSCTTRQSSIALDSNWRWTHHTSNYTNCYTDNEWDTSYCPDPTTCASNCAIDGANYSGTYGISASGNSVSMQFVTNGQYSTNIGSRVYVMEDENNYHIFNLMNAEITFDVDMSQLPCGLNGAVYLVGMEKDGGKAQFSGNEAGAKYGTGYCDAQCPHDIKFINGEANVLDWQPSDTDPNAGTGRYGTCCSEMDLWEANSMAAAYTPHSCTGAHVQKRCEGIECGDSPENRYDGICDKDGCDFNSYRMGDPSFLGKGKTVDTNSKITVVTQFVSDNGSSSGNLAEIRRVYVQNGRVIQNSRVNIPGMDNFDSLTDEFCTQQKVAFSDRDGFTERGGMRGMGEALKTGMVLVLSLWDDHTAHMLWLDSSYPLDRDDSQPGTKRGECPRDSGDPKDVEANHPDATVIYSNIKYGPLDSTY